MTDEQKDIVTALAKGAGGNLNPMAAVLGGIVAQEVIKAASGKFMPIMQWLYYDAVEALPQPLPSEADCAPTGCRYDGQIAVFGRALQQRIAKLRLFLVGAGAIGCEMLKNLALIGAACDGEGHVTVTDMDRIEKSNLSRQFLFRPADIDSPKSHTAVRAVKAMNPAFQATATETRVGASTEDTFDDTFWDGLDVVCTALDNIQARLCVLVG